MKLTTVTMVSLDGVMQGPGGSEEDRSEGFERGGWALPFFDDEGMTSMNEIYERAGAFLFGRRTFEIFARSWGTPEWVEANGLGYSPVASALNSRPKYVASTTLADPEWADTHVLSGDLATPIDELRAESGGDVVVPGSGVLIRWLLDHDLVDEMTLFTCPVIVGQGTRLFPDAGPDGALELVESRATATGVTISVYRTGGRPEYATGSV